MKKSNNAINRSKHESGFYEQLTDKKRTKSDRKTNSLTPAKYMNSTKNHYLRDGNNDVEDEPTAISSNSRSKYKSMITKSPGQHKQYLRQQPPQQHIEEIDSSDEEVAQAMVSQQDQRASNRMAINEGKNENGREQIDYDDEEDCDGPETDPQIIELNSDSEPETNEQDNDEIDEEEDEDANNNVVQGNERVESTSSDIVITSCDYTLYNKDLEEISMIHTNGNYCSLWKSFIYVN